jgi:PTH1 family peptidyl-tRNA hydrolase
VHEPRFHGALAKAPSGVRLLKPATYMNLSGRAVAAVANFFGIAPEAILVAHDELDLPPGDAKLKLGGGVAGHNGLKDIRVQLGTADWWRLRIGIGHPRDSAIPQQPVVDYVLRPPLADERRALGDAIDRSLSVWEPLAAGDFERAMTALHTRQTK